MFKISYAYRSAGIALIAVSAFVHASAQTPEKTPIPTDPANAPRKQVAENDDAFKRWLDRDAKYIITPAERAAFLRLKTNEERENFIDTFWRLRDPDPDTEVNEFRERYYERIAYANEHFASGIPGWQTDRGRIYITWGKPDSIESSPSGGSYERPSYEGGGSITTYPFEKWFYRHLDGPGDGVEIEFVDPTGTGEYRLARGPDDKNAVATVPGLGRSQGQANGVESYQRVEDSPLSWITRLSSLDTPPSPKFTDLYRVLTDGPVIDNNPLNFDVRVDFFRQSDDRVVTAFTIQADNRELSFGQTGGLATAKMNILGRITAVSNKRGGIFEDSVVTTASAAELADTRSRRSIYQKPIVLAPGVYKVEIVVRDVTSGNRGVVSLGFTVPRYDTDTLSASSLVIASKLRSATATDVGGQFVIGNTKVVPNLSGVFTRGEDIGIYLQVYNAQIDQTTLRPAVDVDYVLLRNGKEVMRQKEDWTGLSDSGQRLTLARILASSQLDAGEYEIRVEMRDRVRGNSIEAKGKFELVK